MTHGQSLGHPGCGLPDEDSADNWKALASSVLTDMRLTVAAACCEDGLSGGSNSARGDADQEPVPRRGSAVTMVAQLYRCSCNHPVTSLGSSFIPFLWAVVISAHHLLRRSSGASQ